jgi:hypothetical protein
MEDAGFLLLLIIPFIVGAAIIILSLLYIERSWTRRFMLIMGASLAAFPVLVVLHNAVYGVFILLFGGDFWKGGDEPVLMILAVIVCPLGFLTGIIGSLVIAVRRVLHSRP